MFLACRVSVNRARTKEFFYIFGKLPGTIIVPAAQSIHLHPGSGQQEECPIVLAFFQRAEIHGLGMEIPAWGHVRILIADDDIGLATALAALVQTCGHEVVDVVYSGLAAIKSYQRNPPDVVLMDYNMARLNGLTASRNILSSDPAGKIVFLSGGDYAEDLAPVFPDAVAFLQKPLKIEDLERALAKLIKSQQAEKAHVSTLPLTDEK